MARLQLAPYVRVRFSGTHLEVGCGSIQQVVLDKHLQKAVLEACDLLRVPKLEEAVETYLQERGYTSLIIQKCWAILRNGMLLPEGAYHHQDRYSSSLLYYTLSGANPDNIQRKISENHIAIVGCGGLGGLIAANLSALGVQKLTLIDRDEVETSHLSSEILMNEGDVGSTKVSSLAKTLRMKQSHMKIQEMHDCAMRDNLSRLEHCNLIVITTRDPHPLTETKQFAARRKIPFLEVGTMGDTVFVGPLIKPDSPLSIQEEQICIYKDLQNQCNGVNIYSREAHYAPLSMLAASLATLDIIKFLGDFGEVATAKKPLNIWTHKGVLSAS